METSYFAQIIVWYILTVTSGTVYEQESVTIGGLYLSLSASLISLAKIHSWLKLEVSVTNNLP